MDTLRFLVLCSITFFWTHEVMCSTDADIEQVLQRLREKLHGIEKDLSTLEELKEPALYGVDSKNKQQEYPQRPQSLPSDKQKPAHSHPSGAASSQKQVAENVHKRTVAVPSEEIHQKPLVENDQLKAFRNSLTPEQQQLLKNHYSKASLIQTLLGQQKAVDKRDQPEPVAPAQISPELQDYYKNLSPQEQELIRKHPSQAAHLIAALQDAQKAGPVDEVESPVSKRQLAEENSDWPMILKDMLTHINALKEITRKAAEHHQVNSITVDELTNQVLDDVKMARDKGIRLEDLLKSLHLQGPAKVDNSLVEGD